MRVPRWRPVWLVCAILWAAAAAPAHAARSIHVLLMACTEYSRPALNAIAPSCEQDRLQMTGLFTTHVREQAWGARLNLVDLAGRQATSERFWAELDRIATGTGRDDVVVVYFTGHGGMDTESRRPYLLACDDTYIDRARLSERLRALDCKLRILLTDCCSNYLKVEVAEGSEDVVGDRMLKRLLLHHSGFTDVTAASPGQFAYATTIGGYLTMCLANDMIRYPTWREVFEKTREKVLHEAEESVGKRQEPHAYSLATPDEPSAAAAPESDMVIPDSSTRPLPAAELAAMSLKNLYLARNEIFARHGHAFRTPYLKSHFSGTSWYRPRGDGADVHGELSAVERANVEAIRAAESAHGGPLVPEGAAPATASADEGDVFPYSSAQLIPREVLQTLPLRTLSLARNEIYARHGYIFRSPALRRHFARRTWYRPRSNAQPQLEGVERANCALIEKIERLKGGPAKW